MTVTIVKLTFETTKPTAFVVTMLSAHALDREWRAPAARSQEQRKQHLLLLLHVRVELLGDAGEHLRETYGAFRARRMHRFHFARQPNKVREFAAMRLVKALQDERDEVCNGVRRRFVGRPEIGGLHRCA